MDGLDVLLFHVIITIMYAMYMYGLIRTIRKQSLASTKTPFARRLGSTCSWRYTWTTASILGSL